MNKKLQKYDLQAAELFRSSNEAILSTVSKKFDGFPFGSYITYVTGRNRSIYLYASDIAEHTKNLKNNSKACITVSRSKDDEDKQNSARLTIMGNLTEVSKDELEDCQQRFQKFLPESKTYSQMHDFKFYELRTENIRWIGGFGEIAWLSRFPVRKRITLLVTSSSPRRPRSNETAVGDPTFLGLCASVAAAENAAKLPFYYWSRAETSFLCTTMPAAATTQSQLE